MRKPERKAIDSVIIEFETNFNLNKNFNFKVSRYLQNHEDEWADIWEAKDNLNNAIMAGAATDTQKLRLANVFSAVATKALSKDELQQDFPASMATLSKADVSTLGSDVEKLFVELTL